MPGWLGKAVSVFLFSHSEWIERKAGVRCWSPARSLDYYPWCRRLILTTCLRGMRPSTLRDSGTLKNRDGCSSKANRLFPRTQAPLSWPHTHHSYHCNYNLIVTPPALSFNLYGFSSMHKSQNCSVRLCTLSCPFRALEQPPHPWCQGRLSPSALPLARSRCYISLRHAGVSHKLSLSCSTGRTRPVESTEMAGVYSTPAVDGQLKARC